LNCAVVSLRLSGASTIFAQLKETHARCPVFLYKTGLRDWNFKLDGGKWYAGVFRRVEVLREGCGRDRFGSNPVAAVSLGYDGSAVTRMS
jgi:hypothetical protein